MLAERLNVGYLTDTFWSPIAEYESTADGNILRAIVEGEDNNIRFAVIREL